MNCPSCGGSLGIIETRDSGRHTRRRRACRACGERFTTYEAWEPDPQPGRPAKGGYLQPSIRRLIDRASTISSREAHGTR